MTAARTLLSALGIAAMQAAPAAASPDWSAWVQMAPAGAQVRAIVSVGSDCPVAMVDGKPLPLVRRSPPDHSVSGFPTACQAQLPQHANKLLVNDQALPVPKADVRRIIVIGDTGCRVTEAEVQDCDAAWPFPEIAAAAAAREPDLIIHVGDYYYRERCPQGVESCESWTDWNLDFFDPARPLFGAAPLVLARGNHESCSRGWQGWYRYLAPAEMPKTCPVEADRMDEPFDVQFDGLTLEVIDSSHMPDGWSAHQKLAFLDGQSLAAESRSERHWIVTHKPPFKPLIGSPVGTDTASDAAVAKAQYHGPSGLQLILAGHLHLFSAIGFGPERPAQMIVGNGGTRLMVAASAVDRTISLDDPNAMVAGKATIGGRDAEYVTKARFGYILLERVGESDDGWAATLFGSDDLVVGECRLEDRTLRCQSRAPTEPPARSR